LKVLVVTHSPSPYQVELFDGVAKAGVSLEVSYLHSRDANRLWRGVAPNHNFTLLADDESYLSLKRSLKRFDLVVFNYYQCRRTLTLLRQRHSSGLPWCFWGERPGFHGLGRFGRLYRRWRLSAIRRTSAPVWGLGKWAVDGYRSEFGPNRLYLNVPYFSDLSRFKRTVRQQRGEGLTILFSGSLVLRKGIDVLAKAFRRLAKEQPGISLIILGVGELQRDLQRILAAHEHQVRFVGFRDWEALPEIYRSADVLCAPSRYDGWNLAVPEGLAASLPVVATDRTGAALDLIRPGHNGWIVPAGDANALYETLRSVARMTPAQLEHHSSCAAESISNHTLDHGVARFCSALQASIESF